MLLQKALVVVPTLNEALHIEECLRSLLADLPEGLQVECVVADGGSTDGTQAIVEGLGSEFPNLSLLHNPDRLQSAAINLAVSVKSDETYRVLIRCDAHASYPAGFITNLIAVLINSGAASVVVPMDAQGTTAFGQAAAYVVDSKIGSGGSRHRGGRESGYVDHGHHAAFDLDWFRKVGGYDITFSHNEDAEYDHRLAQAGGKIWLEASVRIGYFMRPTLRGLARQYLSYGAGRARTISKHGLRPRLRQLIPVLNFLSLGFCLTLGILWPVFWLWPSLYCILLASFGSLAAFGIGRLSGLWAAPALFVIHNMWAIGFLRSFWRHNRTDNNQPLVASTRD